VFDITPTEWTAILLSLRVATVATLVATPLAVAIAWLLARREFWGKDAIRAWLDREIIGDKVTTSPTSTAEQYGEVIVHAVTDGDYDKTGLPDPLVLTYYFTVRDDCIVRLIIIRNEPTPAWA